MPDKLHHKPIFVRGIYIQRHATFQATVESKNPLPHFQMREILSKYNDKCMKLLQLLIIEE